MAVFIETHPSPVPLQKHSAFDACDELSSSFRVTPVQPTERGTLGRHVRSARAARRSVVKRWGVTCYYVIMSQGSNDSLNAGQNTEEGER